MTINIICLTIVSCFLIQRTCNESLIYLQVIHRMLQLLHVSGRSTRNDGGQCSSGGQFLQLLDWSHVHCKQFPNLVEVSRNNFCILTDKRFAVKALIPANLEPSVLRRTTSRVVIDDTDLRATKINVHCNSGNTHHMYS